MTAIAAAPMFRPWRVKYATGASPDGYESVPLEPVDAAGLAALLQSGEHRPGPGHGLHVSLVSTPGLADIPLLISGGPEGPWTVCTRSFIGGPPADILAEIPAADPALAADYPIGA